VESPERFRCATENDQLGAFDVGLEYIEPFDRQFLHHIVNRAATHGVGPRHRAGVLS
jgi:hypothetical protein